MEKRGGVLMLQGAEPRRLIGSMISVCRETGEEWIIGSFFCEPDVFSLTDDGSSTRLYLAPGLPMSFVALLRVSVAEFEVFRGRTARPEVSTTDHAEIRAQSSLGALTMEWPSKMDGFRSWMEGDQTRMEWRADFACALERAMVAQLARIAAVGE